MQQEVKENKRFKISDRNLSSDKLFANPTVQPTVGAGGQYSVRVQEQPKNSWEKLSESLAGMMGAASAIQQWDVADNEAAQQVVSEMSDEEFKAAVQQAEEANEAEKGLFESGKFVDRLTRLGKASPTENPLTFTRGQHAAGMRIGRDEYAPMVEQRLKDARKAFESNGTPYTVEDIQSQVKDEIQEKYGMADTFSLQRGFDKAIASEVKAQKIRDINEKDRLQRVRREGDSAIAVGAAMDKMIGADITVRKEIMQDLNMQLNDMSPAEINRSIAKAARDAALDSPETLSAMQKLFAEDGNKLGGYPLNSPAFATVRTLMDDLAEKVEVESKRQNNKEKSEVNKKMSESRSAILYPDNNTFRAAGIDVEGLDLDKVYTNKIDMLDDFRQAVIATVPHHKRFLYSGILYEEVYRSEKDLKARQESEIKENFYMYSATADTATSVQAKDVNAEYTSVMRNSQQFSPSVISAYKEQFQALQTNLRRDKDLMRKGLPPTHYQPKLDAEGNEIPFNQREDLEEVLAFSKLQHIEEYRTNIGKAEAKELEVVAANADKKFNEMSSDQRKDTVKSNYSSMQPEPVFLKQANVDDNVVWAMAKADANDKIYADLLLDDDNSQKALRSLIDEGKKVKDDDGKIRYYGTGRGGGSRLYTRPINLEKNANLVNSAKKYIVYTLNDLETLTPRGYITPTGSTNGFFLSNNEAQNIKIKIQSDGDKKKILDIMKRAYPLYDEQDLESSIYKSPSK